MKIAIFVYIALVVSSAISFIVSTFDLILVRPIMFAIFYIALVVLIYCRIMSVILEVDEEGRENNDKTS